MIFEEFEHFIVDFWWKQGQWAMNIDLELNLIVFNRSSIFLHKIAKNGEVSMESVWKIQISNWVIFKNFKWGT